MQLRDYQQDTCTAVRAAWEEHTSVLVVLPTGSGKTEVFVELAGNWREGRVLIVAPLIQLVGQAAKKITQRTGILPGIEQADQESCEHEYMRSPFVVGSKQSLTGKRKRYERLKDIGLVIVDEAHLAISKPYKEMLDHFIEGGAKVLGVTATPNRNDGLALGNLFEYCAMNIGIPEGVKEGWLVRAKACCIQLESMDLSEVGTRGKNGDFKEGELAKVMEQDKVVFEIADVTARESGDLKTVVFCASVNEAQAVAERLTDQYGKRADWICGDKRRCSDARRKEVLDSFTDDPDGLQFVCNCQVLCLGWDFPGLEHIVMARPTKSLSFYIQIFGRATRPLEGVVDFEGSTPESRIAAIAASEKPYFKITDLVDNSLEHKIVTSSDVLGGQMGMRVRERARKKMEESDVAMDVQVALTDAEVELKIEEREQKKREEEEMQRLRRRAIDAKVKYNNFTVDPFNQNEVAPGEKKRKGARMLFGKFQGELVADLPWWYLRWLVEDFNMREGWLKGAAYKEYSVRKGVPVQAP